MDEMIHQYTQNISPNIVFLRNGVLCFLFCWGEKCFFLLHFLCWWWWWGGEESSPRGDVMPMISLFSLLSPNRWCHVYFWLNIHFLWDSYTTIQILRWRDPFLKLSWHLIWDSGCQTAEILTILRQKKCTIRLKNHFEDHSPRGKKIFLTSCSPWLSHCC